MMNLRQIQIFCAVMRYRKTTSAAYALGASQPTISNAIRNLEEKCGIVLFERHGNRLVPTAEAISLYQDAEHLSDMSDIMRQKIVDVRDGRAGSLRVLTTQALCTTVSSALPRFLKDRPGARLYFDVRPLHGVLESLEAGFVDIGFGVNPLPRPEIIAEPIFKGQMIVALPLHHELVNRDLISPHDLRKESVIGPKAGIGFGRLIESVFIDHQMAYAPKIEVRHSTTACILVEKGLGVAIIDEFTALPTERWKLCFKKFTPQIDISACVLYPAKPKLSRLASRFLAQVKAIRVQ